MMVSKSTLLVAAAAGTLVLAAGDTSNMGPTALMWPPDRVWTSEADNIAPCGSPAGPGNRTQFPLSENPPAESLFRREP